VAETAAHVTVFQRSAPYTIGKPNRAYSPWQKKLFASVPAVQRASRLRQYLWFELLGVAFTTMPGVMRLPTRAWHQRLRRTVPDPELRAKVTPDYLMGCKRLLRAPDWYRTLSRPDVTLVTDPIAEIQPDGLRTADGVVHPLDVLILGTGFKATEFLTPMRVTGRGGRDLAAIWQGGARAYLGTAVSGFPNLFLLYGPGTNLGHSSILFMIESQIAWIRSAIAAMRSHQLRWIDVRPQVQDRYDHWFTTASAGTVWETGCSSWYTRNGHNTNNWPGTTVAFRRRTRRFQLADVESIRTQGANVPPTAEPATVKGLPESTLRAEHLAALPADVPAAPWECRARALIWWQRATAPDFDWQGRPVPLAVAGFVEYLDTPVGPYHEVLAGNLLRTGRLPVSQVPFIAVDSLASVAGGRANWALPKTMADFEVDLASATARAEGDGWSVAVRPVSAPPRSPGRLPIRLRTSAAGPLGRYPTSLRATGRLVRVHTRAEGQTLAGWLGHGPRWAVLLTGRLRVGEPRP
jgi:hypothetical protein